MKEKKGIIIAAVLLLLVCAGAAILYGKFRPSGEAGSKNVTVVVVHGDQSEQTFEYHTKQQWWCITKGGETVNTSAEQTPIADGDRFELTMKEGY